MSDEDDGWILVQEVGDTIQRAIERGTDPSVIIDAVLFQAARLHHFVLHNGQPLSRKDFRIRSVQAWEHLARVHPRRKL